MAAGTSVKRDPFRWKILALISVSHIIGASAQYGINTLAPFYKDELGLVARSSGVVFFGFLSGHDRRVVWHRLARRPLGRAQNDLARACAPSGLCTVRGGVCAVLRVGLRELFLWPGLGYSFLNPASTIGVMAWFHRDERATAMGDQSRPACRPAAFLPAIVRRRWFC